MTQRNYLGQGKNFGNTRLAGVADGTNPTDAVTLQQLQALVRGLRWKEPARVASTANVTLTNPGASIDGVALAANDRVLLKNQTTGSENGLYVWTASGSALTRALDADTSAKLVGASVLITEGTTNGDKQFNQTVEPVTLGTTALVWAQFGGGVTYSAGNGVNLAGTTFSAVAGNGIVVDGTGIRVDTAIVVRKFAQAIGDGTATTIAVNHNLGTTDVQVELILVSTGETIDADVVRTSANAISVSFGTAPASNAIRVVVQG